MSITNNILSKIYKCDIKKTGNTISSVRPFKLPIDINEPFVYDKEEEFAIFFRESELRHFLIDYEHYVEVLELCRENPIFKQEYEKLLILLALYK
jgi:hypothetical protein